jgi:hypothetical protein
MHQDEHPLEAVARTVPETSSRVRAVGEYGHRGSARRLPPTPSPGHVTRRNPPPVSSLWVMWASDAIVVALRQFPHRIYQYGFALKTNARQFRHRDVTIHDFDAIGEAAVGLKQIGIILVAA